MPILLSFLFISVSEALLAMIYSRLRERVQSIKLVMVPKWGKKDSSPSQQYQPQVYGVYEGVPTLQGKTLVAVSQSLGQLARGNGAGAVGLKIAEPGL